jgi:transposase-like protein
LPPLPARDDRLCQLQRLLELEIEGLTGVAYGERSSDRLAQRNGYRDRIRETVPARLKTPPVMLIPLSLAHVVRGDT